MRLRRDRRKKRLRMTPEWSSNLITQVFRGSLFV